MSEGKVALMPSIDDPNGSPFTTPRPKLQVRLTAVLMLQQIYLVVQAVWYRAEFRLSSLSLWAVSSMELLCLGFFWLALVFAVCNRLVGLVVKASASRAEDPGFESRLRRVFFGVESYQ